jgi:hypothetical protein
MNSPRNRFSSRRDCRRRGSFAGAKPNQLDRFRREGDIADRDDGRRIWRIAGVDLTSALGWTTVVAATADLRHSRKVAQRDIHFTMMVIFLDIRGGLNG